MYALAFDEAKLFAVDMNTGVENQQADKDEWESVDFVWQAKVTHRPLDAM